MLLRAWCATIPFCWQHQFHTSKFIVVFFHQQLFFYDSELRLYSTKTKNNPLCADGEAISALVSAWKHLNFETPTCTSHSISNSSIVVFFGKKGRKKTDFRIQRCVIPNGSVFFPSENSIHLFHKLYIGWMKQTPLKLVLKAWIRKLFLLTNKKL